MNKYTSDGARIHQEKMKLRMATFPFRTSSAQEATRVIVCGSQPERCAPYFHKVYLLLSNKETALK